MSRAVVLVAGLLVALAAAPAAAHASAQQETLLMDDNRLLHRGPRVADATLVELRALGVDRVRVSVHWRNLASARRAPADPASPAGYDPGVFDAYDHLVRRARSVGLDVLFNVTGGAPRWATGREGGRFVDPTFAPDPAAFHHFARMVGRRYDGTYPDENQGGGPLPRVSAWSVWNEPNHGAFLQPQWVRDGARRWHPASPARYRRLARAGLSGLAAAGHTTATDVLLLGETSPLGNGDRRGRRQTIAPAAFLREVLCLDRRLRPLRGAASRRAGCDFARRGPLAVTGYAHHPYSIMSAPDTRRANRDEVSLADLARLTRILDAGRHAGAPAGAPAHLGHRVRLADPARSLSRRRPRRRRALVVAGRAPDPRRPARGRPRAVSHARRRARPRPSQGHQALLAHLAIGPALRRRHAQAPLRRLPPALRRVARRPG